MCAPDMDFGTKTHVIAMLEIWPDPYKSFKNALKLPEESGNKILTYEEYILKNDLNISYKVSRISGIGIPKTSLKPFLIGLRK